MGVHVQYGDISMSADFALPELESCISGSTPDLTVHSTGGDHLSPAAWAHQWLSDGDVALSVARITDGYVVSFDDGRSFTFDPDARTVNCPQPIDAAVRHQLLDQVLPRVLEHLGHMMVHASAVRTPQGVVLFVAEAGVGKSTLAASFQSAGVELLSDDCVRLVVGSDARVRCIPTYRSLRLWSDSADAVMATEPYEPMTPGSDKRRLSLVGAPSVDADAVTAICVLAADDGDSHEIACLRVAPALAVSLLVAQCFRLDPTDAAATKRTFEHCVDVVERVPVVELAYPRDYERLPEVRDVILQRAATGDWTPISLDVTTKQSRRHQVLHQSDHVGADLIVGRVECMRSRR